MNGLTTGIYLSFMVITQDVPERTEQYLTKIIDDEKNHRIRLEQMSPMLFREEEIYVQPRLESRKIPRKQKRTYEYLSDKREIILRNSRRTI